ncbi:hypothetical protein RJT34_00355 [Clitoria ternatea]|uniref:Uncharacterized protein n=1 Tax=Clitoria ternatea TaxID=43366 RepID=A0AAN9Q0M0_CLITE
MPHCIYNMNQMIRYNIEFGGAIAARVDSFTKGQAYVYAVNPNRRTIDLSVNNLSGAWRNSIGIIPPGLAGLTFMGYLNLSYNNFVGLIPTGTQLQSFDASSYIGNLKLCRAPLKKCFTDEKNPDKGSQDAEDGGPERESFYLGMGVGFAFGFWGIFGSLLHSKMEAHILSVP